MDPKRETHPAEYVIVGLCVWFAIMGLTGGLLQALGLTNGAWWWASLIALGITACALRKVHRDENPPRSLPAVDPLAQLLGEQERDRNVS